NTCLWRELVETSAAELYGPAHGPPFLRSDGGPREGMSGQGEGRRIGPADLPPRHRHRERPDHRAAVVAGQATARRRARKPSPAPRPHPWREWGILPPPD